MELNEEKLKQEQEKYLNERKEETKKVTQHPFKLLQTRKVICRKCAGMVARNVQNGTPQELENPNNYCVYCRKKLERIWK